DAGRIQVAVRVRPFSEKEVKIGARCIISMSGSQTCALDPAFFDTEFDGQTQQARAHWERSFAFDHSFWSHDAGGGELATQEHVYKAVGEGLVDNALKGYNGSLLAYGQTGSGKTYTMLGTGADDLGAYSSEDGDCGGGAGGGDYGLCDAGAGIIPRLCNDLFRKVAEMKADAARAGRSMHATVEVSFCEIYNESVRDLFRGTSEGHTLKVREHPVSGAFVPGLSCKVVTSYAEVAALLAVGMQCRTVAATLLNEVSSRSHAVFTINLTTSVGGGGGGGGSISPGGGNGSGASGGGNGSNFDPVVTSRLSKICLVDLAGSERADLSGTAGERLREANNINKSLSALGDVIQALAKKSGAAGRRPRRDSNARGLGLGSPFGGSRRASEGGGGSGGGGGGSGEVFVPYRNSVLTWLLRDSLGGNSKTVMLAAIGPAAESYNETMSTLRYIERAKEIVNTVSVNEATGDAAVAVLRQQVTDLRQELTDELEVERQRRAQERRAAEMAAKAAASHQGMAAATAAAAAAAEIASLRSAIEASRKERDGVARRLAEAVQDKERQRAAAEAQAAAAAVAANEAAAASQE
ncbi:unnamed protein product, partial [Phaeothamnion confervicola]